MKIFGHCIFSNYLDRWRWHAHNVDALFFTRLIVWAPKVLIKKAVFEIRVVLLLSAQSEMIDYSLPINSFSGAVFDGNGSCCGIGISSFTFPRFWRHNISMVLFINSILWCKNLIHETVPCESIALKLAFPLLRYPLIHWSSGSNWNVW